jgi:hypothetical protein
MRFRLLTSFASSGKEKRRLFVPFLLMLTALSAPTLADLSPPRPHGEALPGTSIVAGMDVGGVENPTSADACLRACIAHENCGCWTYLKPNIPGQWLSDEDGHCWLHLGWGNQIKDETRVSGFIDRTLVHLPKPAAGPELDLVGKWYWGNGTLNLANDGVGQLTLPDQSFKCTWSIEPRDGQQKVILRWANGYVDVLLPNPEKTSLAGHNNNGTPIGGSKIPGTGIAAETPIPTGTSGSTSGTSAPAADSSQTAGVDSGAPGSTGAKPGDTSAPTGGTGSTGGKGAGEGTQTQQFSLLLGTRQVEPGQTVEVPVELVGTGDLASLNVTIRYSASVVTVVGSPVKGPGLANALFEANPSEPGVIYLGFAGKASATSPSVIGGIPFKAIGSAGSRTALTPEITSANASSGQRVTLHTVNGAVEIRKKAAGDVDGDGTLTANDGKDALKMSVRLIPIDFIVDMDKDGQVTANDARLILQAAVGKQ